MSTGRNGKSKSLLYPRTTTMCPDERAGLAFYNEIDEYAAHWLRNLIVAGHIAPGVVDTRSIVDLTPEDLHGYTQCHFFAGIGVWSHALRAAGWPDDRPVWTGSCPCQPFSDAGKGEGLADERHLWPTWERLIRKLRPSVVLGEQVASKAALGWWDVVHADLEATGYACGAFDLCAAGVGAPHIRQRLYWLADADQGRGGRHAGAVPRAQGSAQRSVRGVVDGIEPRGAARVLADSSSTGLEGRAARTVGDECSAAERGGGARVVADDDDDGLQELGLAGLLDGKRAAQRDDVDGRGKAGVVGDADADGAREGAERGIPARPATQREGGTFWSDCDWIACRDGKWRPVEPGTFPLAHGASSRVGRLRAYGNAIVAPLAAEFIRAVLDTEEERKPLW